MSSILKYVKKDEHTEYMACAQYADWIPSGFNESVIDAYIVQEIIFDCIIDKVPFYSVHYYEAWKVEDGACEKDNPLDSHDLFCVGHVRNSGDVLGKSIGHFGSVVFKPKVYLVNKDDELYNIIENWSTNEVVEANGLRATYYTDDIAKMFDNKPEYHRENFRHEWDFTDSEIIFKTILQYCKIMYHPESELDKRNFEITIDEFFPEGKFEEIKQRVVEEWNNQ